MAIDPTARIATGARIDASVEIGPYCIIGPQVELQRGVRLLAHVYLTGFTTIGEGTVVYPFSSLGTPPQSVHYRGGATRLVIGAACELREGVTMNTGTESGSGITRVGDRCSFMVGSHVGHDCELGNDVTLANNVVLGGHVNVGNYTFLGGHVAIHQFVRIGEGVMMAGMSAARDDIIPFGFALGQTGALVGLNMVGLRRRARPGPRCIAYAALIDLCSSSKVALPTASKRSSVNSPAIRWWVRSSPSSAPVASVR
jgi:UDP-N-acetylglucosamine acyltransferase